MFVESFTQLIFTYSILCGFGLGLLNPAAFISVLSCFSASRDHAIGVTFAALGLGQTMMPLITDYLQQNTNFRFALGIIGGLSSIGIVGGELNNI